MFDRETYLKTQQLADALGVSSSSVKRWVDKGVIEATKTSGKHRLVALSSALKFARDGKYPMAPLLAMASAPAVVEIDQILVDSLVNALKTGRGREAAAIMTSAVRSEAGAVGLADHLIRPAMERIGHLWMVGAWDVYQEHQATQIVVAGLLDLIRKVSTDDRPDRPMAMGASPEGDIYTLPVLLGELVLRSQGWDVRNLGANLPFRSLASAVRDYRPKLVFFSASMVVDRARFVQEYSYFYEATSQVGAAIILGGRAFDADLRSRLIYASYGDRMAHLAEFARQIHPANEPRIGSSNNSTGSIDILS